MSLVQALLAIFFPPVSVLLQKGLGGAFLLNCLLALLFYFPASIHAVMLLAADRGAGSPAVA